MLLGSRLCKFSHFSGERKIFVHFTIYGEIRRPYSDHDINLWNQYRELENCNTMDNGSEENKFATVMDRRRHSAQFAPVSCHLSKKQFISCITWLTGRVVPRVTLTVTLVTIGGLRLLQILGHMTRY